MNTLTKTLTILTTAALIGATASAATITSTALSGSDVSDTLTQGAHDRRDDWRRQSVA